MHPTVIVGAGGFGREVLWLIHEINERMPSYDVLGFVDDDPEALAGCAPGIPILCSLAEFQDWHNVRAVCAIGAPKVRKAVVDRLESCGVVWETIIHPSAFVGPRSTVGQGSVICRSAGLTVDVRIGDHVHININGNVGHDARIGGFCTLSPTVDVNGGAVLEEGVFLGSHAVVLPKARVGAWARVGAGTVVLRNVSPGKTVIGVPAKEVF